MKIYRKAGGLKYWDWEGIIGFSLLGILALFVLYIFTMMFIDFRNQAICLSYGFPEHNTTWNAIGYCIRTINQTQYVVLIKELLGK